jgi:hypothetical protein
MSFRKTVSKCVHGLRVAFVGITVFQFSLGGPLAGSLSAHDQEKGSTNSPIKHVIVLIGENRSFDHLFATYVPKDGESVSNLLSKGIIKADGTPGPHFKKAQQFQAVAPFKTDYFISLDHEDKAPYSTLPEPTLNFSPSPATGEPPPFPVATRPSLLAEIEPSLEPGDLNLLTTGASGAPQTAELPDFDSRIQNFNNLPNGPFPLKGANLPYDSYTGDTTHRLFEMWQQASPNPFSGNYTVAFVALSSDPAVRGQPVLALSLHPRRLQDAHSFEAQSEDSSPGTVLSYESTLLDKAGPPADVFLLSHPVVKGQSGSPVLALDSRAALGLVEGLWLRGTTLSLAKSAPPPSNTPGAAIPIRYAIALLEQRGILWHTGTSSTTTLPSSTASRSATDRPKR